MMRLSTKGRYSARLMLELALNYGKGPVLLKDIAERQEISLSYLEQLFSRLRKRALVKSIRGPGGGYILARSARDIDVAEVITAGDERLDTTACGGSGKCNGSERCLTHELWQDLSNSIYEYLSNISLFDLTQRQKKTQEAVQEPITPVVELTKHRAQVNR